MSASRTAEVSHADLANAIRALAMDAVQAANSGHPGMPMGMADVATVLFRQFLKFDSARPDWPDRDRFVLSAGHGSMLLYALLYLTGYPDIDRDEIANFRQLGSRTAGHPEFGHAAGIETTTGPLGQGIANAVGMAIAERILAARFGAELVDHHTWVIAGDGDLMEGISHEAASLAGHLGLGRLIVFYDDNHISIDGDTDLSLSDDAAARFASYGWDTDAVNGHDPEAIAAAIERARAGDRPSLIACRTTIGFGAPNKAGTAASHGAALGEDEVAATRLALGWPHPAFEVPNSILNDWRAAGAAGQSARAEWEARLAAAPNCDDFEAAMSGGVPDTVGPALEAFKRAMSESAPAIATRQASGEVLAILQPLMAELVGGSADLTGSNNTRVPGHRPITADDFSGGYLHYGVREHGMAAAMNGMALHGGIVPYSGTFLIFTDYCRPAIRLAALMRQRVIHVMTHDSIGLGEDGPTHQPIEHLASLRAIPNLLVFRPADVVEAAECWTLALEHDDRPSVMALSRQGVPTVRTMHRSDNLSGKGAYELAPADGDARVTLLATGTEISLALEARVLLQADGIATRVVSVPCHELFEAQDDAYRAETLGPGTVKVAVEAAIVQGWERYIGPDGAFVGMDGFGASAPAKDLYKHFGITAEAVAAAARKRL